MWHGFTPWVNGKCDLQLGYLDDDLQRIATDADYAPAGWDVPELDHFLLVAQCANAAISERDLLMLRVLRLRRSTAGNAASVMLSASRMLIIKFEASTTSLTAVFDLSTVETEEL